ncbi:MAG: class I SAM-dependent methyltransferase [Chloroflexi bacterium]|nr:class I SAM-dependent methyltransferase [Chloroflexota bacterium]
MKAYDHIIQEHYQRVAREAGLSPQSTMADQIIRQRETEAILRFIEAVLADRQARGLTDPPLVMDVGCGNGYTLSVLRDAFPHLRLVGVEKVDALRSLAASRFADDAQVRILAGDVRDPDFHQGLRPDVLISQRVLINLLDAEDQRRALANMIHAVREPDADGIGGYLLFWESFQTPLARLNEARAEFGMDPIPPAHHNLYLPDDFFAHPELEPFRTATYQPQPNMLSTHYFVSRVLHAVVTRTFTPDAPFKRNSHFVQFLSSALPPAVGDYAPLKLYVFRRVRPR